MDNRAFQNNNANNKLNRFRHISNIGQLKSRSLNQKEPLWPHIYLALFGAGWSYSLEVGFRIYIAEVISIIGIFIIPWFITVSKYPLLRKILVAYSVWAFAILLSDFINQTDIVDWARNTANPVMGAISLIVVLSAASRNPSAILTLLGSMAISKALLGEASYGDAFQDQAINYINIQEDTNFFKVRVEPSLNPLFILIACYASKFSLKYSSILFFALSFIYFAFDSRSTGLTFFLSSIAIMAIHMNFHSTQRRVVFITFLATILASISYVTYINYTLIYNFDGHNGKQIQKLDNPYNPLELMAQGRAEWFAMPSAITEKPLIGWGSWAEDKDLKFVNLQAERSHEQFQNAGVLHNNRIHIPAHSLIGSAWLWSGALGLLAMLLILRSVWAMVSVLSMSKSILLPAGVFMAVSFFWILFFSPPTLVRLNFPVFLATLILTTNGLFGGGRSDHSVHTSKNRLLKAKRF